MLSRGVHQDDRGDAARRNAHNVAAITRPGSAVLKFEDPVLQRDEPAEAGSKFNLLEKIRHGVLT